MQEAITKDGKAVFRHGFIELAEHWLLALSGFLLIFSGFGELPMYKRFMVTQIPGLGWVGDYFINLKIHYLAGIVFVSLMVFHAVYHGWLGHQGLLPKKGDMKASLTTILSMFGIGEEPEASKYLPEQRLAYAYLGGIGFILVVTGVIKVMKNLPGVYFSPGLVTWNTLIHTFATIFFLLGVVAHLLALIFKVNRPLVRSIFTGEVDLAYVQDRHTVWYNELKRPMGAVEEEPRWPADVAPEVAQREKSGSESPAEKEIPSEQVEIVESTERKESDVMASTLKVKGMTCQHCVMSVKKALGNLEGIQNVNVDLQKGEVLFDNTKGLAADALKKAIEEAGYEVV
jgi:formate dehydrogenase gamma subunit